MPIDLDGPEPLYVQVAGDLTRRIAAGEFPPGRRVPSARKLAEEYDVSTRTTEAALTLLRDRGLVRGVVGRGTFVTDAGTGDRLGTD
jgi:DNA-binding GntR family transcriptional regulator